jgi:hypothetical protein
MLPLYPRRTRVKQIEVAPDRFVVDLPPQAVPRICVSDLIPQGDHTYRAVARVHQAEIRVTPDVLSKLNLGVRHQTLLRLIRAGFVNGSKIAPNCYVFDLQSYFDHRELMRKEASEGRDFWTGENLARYRAAIW